MTWLKGAVMPSKVEENEVIRSPLTISTVLLYLLVTGPMMPEQFATMPRGLKKVIAERALGAVPTRHLSANEELGALFRGNCGNGATLKAVVAEGGDLQLKIPRERAGAFEP